MPAAKMWYSQNARNSFDDREFHAFERLNDITKRYRLPIEENDSDQTPTERYHLSVKERENRLAHLRDIYCYHCSPTREVAPLSDLVPVTLEEIVAQLYAKLPKRIDDFSFNHIDALILINCGLTDDFFDSLNFGALPCATSILILADNCLTRVPYESITTQIRYGLDYLDLSGNQLVCVDFSRLSMVRRRLSLAYNRGVQVLNTRNFVSDCVVMCGCDLGPEAPPFDRVEVLDFSANPRLERLVGNNVTQEITVDHCPGLFLPDRQISQSAILKQFPRMISFSAIRCGIVDAFQRKFIRGDWRDGFVFRCDLSENPIIHFGNSSRKSPNADHTFTLLDKRYHLEQPQTKAAIMPSNLMRHWFDPVTCASDLMMHFFDLQHGDFWKDMTKDGYVECVFGTIIVELRKVVLELPEKIKSFVRTQIPYHALATYLFAILCPKEPLSLSWQSMPSRIENSSHFEKLLDEFRQVQFMFLELLEKIFGLDAKLDRIKFTNVHEKRVEKMRPTVGASFEAYYDKFLRSELVDLKKLNAEFNKRRGEEEQVNHLQARAGRAKTPKTQRLRQGELDLYLNNHPDVLRHPSHSINPIAIMRTIYGLPKQMICLDSSALINPIAEEVVGTWAEFKKSIKDRPLKTLPSVNISADIVATFCLQCLLECRSDEEDALLPHTCQSHKAESKKRSAPDANLSRRDAQPFWLPLTSGVEADVLRVKVENVVIPLSRALLVWHWDWSPLLASIGLASDTQNTANYLDLTGLKLIGSDDIFSWFLALAILYDKLNLPMLEKIPQTVTSWNDFNNSSIFAVVNNFLKLRDMRRTQLDSVSL